MCSSDEDAAESFLGGEGTTQQQAGTGPRGPPTTTQPRIDHIFATVARIDLRLAYSERSHRTTSEYTIYLKKSARPKKIYDLFENFWTIFLKIFEKILTFSKFLKNSKNYENFKISKFQKFMKISENFHEIFQKP